MQCPTTLALAPSSSGSVKCLPYLLHTEDGVGFGHNSCKTVNYFYNAFQSFYVKYIVVDRLSMLSLAIYILCNKGNSQPDYNVTEYKSGVVSHTNILSSVQCVTFCGRAGLQRSIPLLAPTLLSLYIFNAQTRITNL